MRNRDVGLAVKNADGDVDLTALQTTLDSLISKAPKELKSDVTYLTKVIVAFVEVHENTMSSGAVPEGLPEAQRARRSRRGSTST